MRTKITQDQKLALDAQERQLREELAALLSQEGTAPTWVESHDDTVQHLNTDIGV